MANLARATMLCKHCKKSIAPEAFFYYYDFDGIIVEEGCLSCLAHSVVITSPYTPRHQHYGDCPTCYKPYEAREMGTLRTAALGVPTILHGCRNCIGYAMSAMLKDFSTIGDVGTMTATLCQYCKCRVPYRALYTYNLLDPGNPATVLGTYNGCWDCLADHIDMKALEPKNGSIDFCWNCSTPFASLTGAAALTHRIWYLSNWHTCACNACFEQRVANAITYHALPGAAMATTKVNINVPAGYAQQLLAPTLNTSASPQTLDGALRNATTLGVLRDTLQLAARYVQVCNEGGDWDIIDKSPDTSKELLILIRSLLDLPGDHDFTKR